MEPTNIEAALKRIVNGQSSHELSVDELVALLCQISLALLIIYVMANVLFMAKAKAEVDEAKGKLPYYREKLEEIMTTDVGREYERREVALIDLQKQKLLNVLEGLEAADRAKLALSLFCRPAGDGGVEFAMDDVLSGEKVTDRHFIEACKYAKTLLPYQDRMYRSWLTRTLLLAAMRLQGSGESALICRNPEVVTRENEQWLVEEIRRRVKALYAESCHMQRTALARLQNYYRSHTEALKGQKVREMMDRYVSAPPEEKAVLIPEISRELYRSVKSVFESQGVPLLNDV
jgi:hypothetical protein